MTVLSKVDSMVHYIKYLDPKEGVFMLMLDKETRRTFKQYQALFVLRGLRKKQFCEFGYYFKTSFPIFMMYYWEEDEEGLLDYLESPLAAVEY